MPTEACLEEFEALAAIFLDEIQIGEEDSNGSTKVSMVLYPATGDDQESKYVTLTLELNLPKEYPKVSPVIRFRNPRGLSETLLNLLYNNMVKSCEEKLESLMIFELIDMAKEFLTINNRPASECPICLHSFTSCDTFFRSQCFHHFHSYCLGRYLQNVMQVLATGDHLPGDAPEKSCPVCREKLDDDIDVQKLLESPPPFEETSDNVIDGDAVLKKWHCEKEKLKTLFDKQKSQGGIIDLNEVDKKRLVISSPRQGGDGGDSPSSSSEVSSVAEGDLVLMHTTNATDSTVGGTQISSNRSNLRNDTRNKGAGKESTKEKCSANVNTVSNSNGSQNGQVKTSVVVPKPGHQDSETAQEKTSPTMGRHARHGHHGRGKGGYGHGNYRRRYK